VVVAVVAVFAYRRKPVLKVLIAEGVFTSTVDLGNLEKKGILQTFAFALSGAWRLRNQAGGCVASNQIGKCSALHSDGYLWRKVSIESQAPQW
jgi:hypothetical protein